MKGSREEPKLIGTIVFDESINEDKVGKINFSGQLGECLVYVYSNEGTIPHFHLINNSTNFECCICIFEPLYFNHGFKTGIISKGKDRKLLDSWLREPSKVLPKVSNWELIRAFWITGNGDKYCKNVQQPFYVNLQNMCG